MSVERRIEKLRTGHLIEGFDCGREGLNRYLLRSAWSDQRAGAVQTYVGLTGDHVVGYYALALGHVTHEEALHDFGRGLEGRPLPIMLLARLAVSRHWQNRGVGRGLLRDAMQRTVQAADIAGIRALAVHAKDTDARRFYEKFDFVPSPTDPVHLFVLLKDVRRIMQTQ